MRVREGDEGGAAQLTPGGGERGAEREAVTGRDDRGRAADLDVDLSGRDVERGQALAYFEEIILPGAESLRARQRRTEVVDAGRDEGSRGVLRRAGALRRERHGSRSGGA